MRKNLISIMNHTKWEELRKAMLSISPTPTWRTKDINGYLSNWDGDWFYHFQADSHYDTIHYLEIKTITQDTGESVRIALGRIHVPGEEIPNGYRVFGYMQAGEQVDYIE